MTLQATHHTVYEYPAEAVESHNEVRLMPLTGPTQTCVRFRLDIQPEANVFTYDDAGGPVHYFNLRSPHRRLAITATAIVEMHEINPFEGLNLLYPDWDFYAQESTRQNFAEFLTESPYVTLYRESFVIAGEVRRTGTSAAQFLLDLNNYIHDFLDYDPDATHVHSRLDEVILKRAGVCQDYAHLMIACCRCQGIPTRYVSGYLYGGEGIRGELGTHAWVECLLPNGQWLSLDPTNRILANNHHIRVHLGRDYSEVSPTRGIYIGYPASRLDFGVEVIRVPAAERARA